MEKTMMLPAMYNVLSQEEMTYTEGGATMTQALLAALLPPYGWYKASTEIRDYRKKNPNTWLDTGLDAFVAGCEKSVTNAIYGIGCAYNFVAINIATSGIGLIPAAYIIFKKSFARRYQRSTVRGLPNGKPPRFLFCGSKKGGGTVPMPPPLA